VPSNNGDPLAYETTLPRRDVAPASAPAGPLSIPTALLTRFGNLQFLGAGGMGAVYRAEDLRLGRTVALKFLYGADPETSRLLLREARSQARLEHENACKVFEVGVEGDRSYIVMQYIEGAPLERMRARMTIEQKARAVRQVAEALHEAHRLGLVHRDVKPSNIMVEQGEDGTYKPYIMDFGLAREVGAQGQTETSSIAGTPAYMAPEQARGEIAALDRRTDVYALGATLYDMLAGRPPFEGGSTLMILQKVLLEEPTPLRKLRPEVPRDLEAIVMKCLEKEPGQRYDSAKALGEDLQRLLDGEPVQARRASLSYVLSKAARRHKARVALGAMLLAAASMLGALWLRDRQEAAERAAISRELGEDVKEMELFMRSAYGLPLHDIERERGILRQRLRGIEERMASLGRAGEGPGHYALGRGFLTLAEPDEALSHLRRALAAGYAPPELHYAMGLALGELYRRALEDTRRVQDEARKKAMIAAIDAAYKEPALSHLRAALGAKIESPAYVEGLIALHEGRNDVALAKAREAFQASPWLHEAKKLEGDARFAEGSRWRRDAAFDRDRMMQEFEPAAEAYAAAADIARSDPQVHEAACELWIQTIYASEARPDARSQSFEKAKLACGRAILASPGSSSARMKMAAAYNAYAWQTLQEPEKQDPERIIRDAIEHAEEAARFRPDDAMAHYLVGSAYRTEVFHHLDRGLDARASIDRAIAAHEEAIRLDPGFLWPYNELCSSYVARARSETWRGVDPTSSIERAVRRCDQAAAMDPRFTYPHLTKGLAYFRMAEYLAAKGRSPEAFVASALEAASVVRDRHPAGALSPSAWALWVEAAYECDEGRDPTASIERAEALFRETKEAAPWHYEVKGLLALTRALHLLRQRKDPEPSLQAARTSFQKLFEEAPWDVDYRIHLARVEIIALRWAILKGNADTGLFDAAFAPLLPLLDRPRENPEVYLALAEIHALRAGWLFAREQRAEQDGSNGLSMADKALAIHPRMAAALATKGVLFLVQARASRDAKRRSEALRGAKASLEAALRENPLLARELGEVLEDAERPLPE
jgi:serine/threonine-protein kinase